MEFQLLNAPLHCLKNVTPARFMQFQRLRRTRVKDILLYAPSSWVNRSKLTSLSAACDKQIITQKVIINEIRAPKVLPFRGVRSKKVVLEIFCSDKAGSINIVYFNNFPQYLKPLLRAGTEIIVSGKVYYNGYHLQMAHPDIIIAAKDYDKLIKIEPIYQATSSLSSKAISSIIKEAISLLLPVPEWIPISLLAKHKWCTFHDSLRKIHTPKNTEDLNMSHKAIERLAFDELLAEQISLQILRGKARKSAVKDPIKTVKVLIEKLIAQLPYILTKAQQRAIAEITADQKSNKRMIRLLQGDVGSGKTIVVFCAILNAIEGRKQAVLMAPTTILAKQHFLHLSQFAEALGVKVELLTSNLKTAQKEKILNGIKDGSIDFIIGTHTVFQQNVDFSKLGLVVIDEQHKFGVKQRMELIYKGYRCDVLMLSATPIPRTLTLVQYGDMDFSVLDEKPKNRQEITTVIVLKDKINDLLTRIQKIISERQKVYWVCPLIKESEKLDLANATKRFEALAKVFPAAMVHSKIPAAQQEQIMKDFQDPKGYTKILVATTVIEVGVDVPNATVMVIENAERFGLAQLHQLRGRIGRSSLKSYCILLYDQPLSAVAHSRLEVMKNCQDGFQIAEQDLILRGGGRVLSTQQSGLPTFKICDLAKHHYLVEEAHKTAQKLLEDPVHAKSAAISALLDIFRYAKTSKRVKKTQISTRPHTIAEGKF